MTWHDNIIIPCDSKRGLVARLVSESKAFIRERVLHASSPQTLSVAAVRRAEAKNTARRGNALGGRGGGGGNVPADIICLQQSQHVVELSVPSA